jgi:thiamine biosynthesis protein ThiI
MKCIVVHYSEIGTKGQNRGYFERKLLHNIRETIGGKVERRSGRIIIKEPRMPIERLKKIAGVYSYAEAEEVEANIEDIKKTALLLAKKSKARTFRVSAARSDKRFLLSSMKVNALVGAEIVKKAKKKVNLTEPEQEISIIISDKAYVYDHREICMGGLPVGTAGKLVCLLSGGIDSPVAAYKMMTRGCRIVFVHFHNHDPFIEKIKDLADILSKYQGKTTLYLVPFKDVQQQIIKKTDPRFRMLLYRRVMMRIAEEIKEKEHALGLITGDSVAQVASQTLENLNVIYDSIKCPVFSPLIGMNKQEIVEEAKKIGTYEVSIKPYTDCCSVLIAKHPATKGEVLKVRELEEKAKLKTLIKKAIKQTEILKI